MKAKCIVCDRALVAIGKKRGNGVSHHDDWVTRQYHKKCHKNLIWQKDYLSRPPKRRCLRPFKQPSKKSTASRRFSTLA